MVPPIGPAGKPLSLGNDHGPLQALQLHHCVMGPVHGRASGFIVQTREDENVKTTIIAFSAAALIAAAPAVFAQNVSSRTPVQHHKVFKKRPQVVSGYAPWRVVHAKGMTGYPGAFGYAPSVPKDYTYENSRNAGGGGGGGGGSGM